MKRNELIDDRVEVLGQFLIGDPFDLPTDEAGASIAGLVVLRIESAAVPGDVVDLECPPDGRVGAVGVDDGPVGEDDGVLAMQDDAAPFQRLQYAELEP